MSTPKGCNCDIIGCPACHRRFVKSMERDVRFMFSFVGWLALLSPFLMLLCLYLSNEPKAEEPAVIEAVKVEKE